MKEVIESAVPEVLPRGVKAAAKRQAWLAKLEAKIAASRLDFQAVNETNCEGEIPSQPLPEVLEEIAHNLELAMGLIEEVVTHVEFQVGGANREKLHIHLDPLYSNMESMMWQCDPENG